MNLASVCPFSPFSLTPYGSYDWPHSPAPPAKKVASSKHVDIWTESSAWHPAISSSVYLFVSTQNVHILEDRHVQVDMLDVHFIQWFLVSVYHLPIVSVTGRTNVTVTMTFDCAWLLIHRQIKRSRRQIHVRIYTENPCVVITRNLRVGSAALKHARKTQNWQDNRHNLREVMSYE